jgi:hypothetical protein
LKASAITWRIENNVIRMAFLLDFLPAGIEVVQWRVFSSVLDAAAGGPAATDVTPAVEAPLARLSKP